MAEADSGFGVGNQHRVDIPEVTIGLDDYFQVDESDEFAWGELDTVHRFETPPQVYLLAVYLTFGFEGLAQEEPEDYNDVDVELTGFIEEYWNAPDFEVQNGTTTVSVRPDPARSNAVGDIRFEAEYDLPSIWPGPVHWTLRARILGESPVGGVLLQNLTVAAVWL